MGSSLGPWLLTTQSSTRSTSDPSTPKTSPHSSPFTYFPLTAHHLLTNVCPLQPSQCCCCVHPPSIPLRLMFSERRWGCRQVTEESAVSAPCFTLHHRSAAHPLNEIKEQMTRFSLCLFTAVNTHTFDGRSHENR